MTSPSTSPTSDACPRCRHRAHGNWCPNMASDNDCNCTLDATSVVESALDEPKPQFDERRVWTQDGRATEVLRQVGWRGQSSRFYPLGSDYIAEPGSFSLVWECVYVDPSGDRPSLAREHVRGVVDTLVSDSADPFAAANPDNPIPLTADNVGQVRDGALLRRRAATGVTAYCEVADGLAYFGATVRELISLLPERGWCVVWPGGKS